MKTSDVAVIGGGPAGMIAAAFASETKSVTIFEKNGVFGKKLLITGKGRCNVTNDTPVREFTENVPRGGKFLMSALNGFSPLDTMEFFESLGVPLKTERGNRVFPESDKAVDIRDAMVRRMKASSNIRTEFSDVKNIVKNDDGSFTVFHEKGRDTFDSVIVATGGLSYPRTGSTGAGYEFAKELGHTIVPCVPSLVPLECRERYCAKLMGLSLKNCAVRFMQDSKCVYEDFGELLFTHFGVSGPVILSASCHLDPDKAKKGMYKLFIDLKPALDEAKLDKRVLSDFSGELNKVYENSLSALLPSKLIPVMVEMSGIPPRKRVNEITREERQRLVRLLKAFPLTVSGKRPIDEAIITSGGVSLKEVDPKTMESKIVQGLYFAGEILDCDAYTGGFNLQIAFSTGAACGRAVAKL